jgi:hypothetical protein
VWCGLMFKRTILFVGCVLSVFNTAPAYATAPESTSAGANPSLDHPETPPPSPEFLLTRHLMPFTSGIQKRIREQPDFTEVSTVAGPIIFCSFKLGENGEILDLKLESPPNPKSSTVDEKALELIRKSAPFTQPPSDFPYERRIVVAFWNAPVNRNNNPRVFLPPVGWRYSKPDYQR